MSAMTQHSGPQRVALRHNGKDETLWLPASNEEVMPGVLWGSPDELFTPAYWKTQVWFDEISEAMPQSHALGATLREEVAACLLGGYGIPAEVGLAAFLLLKREGVLHQESDTSAEGILAILRRPLKIGSRSVRYRFARQKSTYLAAALQRLGEAWPPAQSALAFRAFFRALPGFGPKTASWLTRNWLGSDQVAILDIHVLRAGLIAGFFRPGHKVGVHYEVMERQFLQFAEGLGTRASVLDAVIWRDMRKVSKLARGLVRSVTA